MCPVCIATAAAWITAAALSTGGMTALVVKKVASARSAANNLNTSTSKEDHHG
jgi:hypothetical protein